MHVKPLGQSLVQSKFLMEVNVPVSVSGKQINENIQKTKNPLTLDTSLPISFCFKLQNHTHRLFIVNQTFSNTHAMKAEFYFCFLEKEQLY